MGYYTAYGISVDADHGFEHQEDEFHNELKSVAEKWNYGDEIDELFEYGVYAKLYDLSDWISELAPKYPHLLIQLSGDGEESDDMWEERWKGVDHEIQKAVIPPFTNSNLLTEAERINRNIQ